MLKFFRRYQKIFFFAITFAVVVSFCFFGTYKTMLRQGTLPVEDQEVGKGISGKAIKAREFVALCHLLETSALDRSSRDRMPNLFNPGVIEKEFLSSGLALMLVKPYFAQMKGDLDERVKKIHQYHPYAHPGSSQVSAEWMWETFSSPFFQRYRHLREHSDQATLETFALMSQLYVEQLGLPPAHMLRQILMMQQNQQDVESDPLLEQADLSLFGFKSLEEWFGPKFVPLAAAFIMNAAQLAEEKGYTVRVEEVRADLLQNVYQGYQQLTRKSDLSAEDVNQYYLNKMHALGFDEQLLLDAWKQVLLFRRVFNDASLSVLIDPLVYQQFEQFAQEGVDVDVYQLPSALQFSDFLSLLKFQLYIEGIASEGVLLRKTGELPTKIATIEQIEKRVPQLVESEITLEWRHVARETLESAVSTKETMTWEIADANWAALQSAFPFLRGASTQDAAARIAALNRLGEQERVQVDAFAREHIVRAHPELVNQAFSQAPLQTTTLGLRIGAPFSSLLGLKETPELVALLREASLKGEEPNVAARQLRMYKADRDQLYSIEVVRREKDKKILTFAQASKDGTLDQLLTELLEKEYGELRKKHAEEFQTASGAWKPLEEVKEQVGRVLFSDLLHSIEEGYMKGGGMISSDVASPQFYSDARFFVPMNRVKERLEKSPVSEGVSLSLHLCDHPLAAQWSLVKEPKKVVRSAHTAFSKEGLWTLNPGSWSPVQLGRQGALSFCFVKGKTDVASLPPDGVQVGHEILSQDAKKDLMEQLLQKIHQEKRINLLGYQSEETLR